MRRNTSRTLALIALMLAALFFVACSSSDTDSDGDADPVATAEDSHDEAGHDDAAADATVDDGHDDADAHADEDLFAQDAHETLVVDMQDILFAPMEISVEVGELVEIELMNSGGIDHDFTIDEIHTAHAYHEPHEEAAGHDDHGAEYAMHHALVPGDSIAMRVIAEEAGTYEFYCSVPGHREAGMVGTLTVTD